MFKITPGQPPVSSRAAPLAGTREIQQVSAKQQLLEEHRVDREPQMLETTRPRSPFNISPRAVGRQIRRQTTRRQRPISFSYVIAVLPVIVACAIQPSQDAIAVQSFGFWTIPREDMRQQTERVRHGVEMHPDPDRPSGLLIERQTLTAYRSDADLTAMARRL
jgi:hypothetical protein